MSNVSVKMAVEFMVRYVKVTFPIMVFLLIIYSAFWLHHYMTSLDACDQQKMESPISVLFRAALFSLPVGFMLTIIYITVILITGGIGGSFG